MRSSFPLMLFAAMLAVGLPHSADAQQGSANAQQGSADAQQGGILYVVTYIEALPSKAEQARALLAGYAEESGRADGNLEFHVLRRIGRPNHFAILESWADDEAHAAHSGSPSAERFRTSLTPLLYSPPDERTQRGLLNGASRESGPDAVYVLTHVDVVPTNLERAVGYLRALAQASRSEGGNLRFDVLVTMRKNHMTIVEAWAGADAQAAHLGEPHSRAFRTNLAPLLGALYDDRLYREL